jgi:glutamyl-tRNA synthetase
VTVRVRFAPNPSGDLHVGSARAALFNWLFARHHGGLFVLRIEDTDPATARPEFIEPILHALRWLGLDWDEGPDIGGAHGPYRQSERREMHQATIDRLVSLGAVYRDYCTPEEVKARGTERGYDRFCRDLSPDQTAAFEAEGRPFALRYRVPDHPVVLHDVVRGDVTVSSKDIQDFVVARSDGTPTFVLANVSDDLAMGITHAIRGEDLISAAVQNVLVYEALGETPPTYVHLPLILDEQRRKLSKRKMATGIHAFREAGYLADALVNFLSLLGWSSESGDEIMPRERIVSEFDLDRVQHHGAVFDREKLDWMNQEYVKALAPDELEALLAELHPEVPAETLRRSIDMDLIQTRVKTLSEVPHAIHYLHTRPAIDPAAREKARLGTEESDRVLTRTAEVLETLEPWTHEAIWEAIQAVAAEVQLNKRKATAPIRVAVSGTTVSLPLPESIEIIGREETVQRLRAAVGSA